MFSLLEDSKQLGAILRRQLVTNKSSEPEWAEFMDC